jgi:hypothetical protein
MNTLVDSLGLVVKVQIIVWGLGCMFRKRIGSILRGNTARLFFSVARYRGILGWGVEKRERRL